MLLSQRIAQDIKFLHSPSEKNKADVFQLRLDIMSAPKFIISPEHISLGETLGETLERINVHHSDKKIKERQYRWRQFARLPYQNIFIENQSGGLFVRKLTDHDGFLIKSIGKDGGLLPVFPIMYLSPHNPENDTGHVELALSYLNKDTQELMTNPEPKDRQWCKMSTDIAYSLTVQVAEVLVFLNTSNTRIHYYTPTSKELGKIPKQQLPHYSYRILDVFRQRDRYESLADIEQVLQKPESWTLDRRAHLVRGHFKTFKRDGKVKLFWWNDFTRCRKNAKEIGVVEKDYRLHLEEETL